MNRGLVIVGLALLIPSCTTEGQLGADSTIVAAPSTSSSLPPKSTTTTAQESISPTIIPIRSITPEEWPQIIGGCMRDRGIDVVIRADGGLITQGLPAEQQDRLQEVQSECKSLFPVDDSYRGLLEVDELTRLYGYYTDILVPCLQGEGYSGFAPPSVETYIDSYATETEWMPYTDIMEAVDVLGEGERFDLFDNCPQAPSLGYLFDD